MKHLREGNVSHKYEYQCNGRFVVAEADIPCIKEAHFPLCINTYSNK